MGEDRNVIASGKDSITGEEMHRKVVYNALHTLEFRHMNKIFNFHPNTNKRLYAL